MFSLTRPIIVALIIVRKRTKRLPVRVIHSRRKYDYMVLLCVLRLYSFFYITKINGHEYLLIYLPSLLFANCVHLFKILLLNAFG